MRILVTGSAGQVGYALLRSLAPLGQVVSVDRRVADLGDGAQVDELLAKYQPDVIVNAAAYTSVDKAESEAGLAARLNTDLPAQLAVWAARNAALLVHYSTDYVFDGGGERAWNENDMASPLSVYGRTKRNGEMAVLESGCDALIFRTSWVYAARGNNFMLTMLRLARERTSLNVVSDQWGAPTPAWLIAAVTALAVQRYRIDGVPASGLFHLACAGVTNWYEFSRAILGYAQTAGVPLRVGPNQVQPISTAQYPTAANRPLNSRLDCARLENWLHIHLPDWRHALELTLKDWLETSRQL